MFTQIPDSTESMIVRPRLLTIIGSRPGITVAEGLPGSGKTQLAVQWAHSASLDKTLWANALGRTSMEAVRELLSAIEALGGESALRIVIDNLMIPLDADTRECIAGLLAQNPETQLLICTRWQGTEVSEDSWNGNVITVIRQEQLCATREENRQFVAQLRHGANDPVADIVWREFRGWFLPTQLAIETGGPEGILQTHHYITNDLLPSLAPAGHIAAYQLAHRLHGYTPELLATLLENHRVLREVVGELTANEVIGGLVSRGLLVRSHMSHTFPLWVAPTYLAQTAGKQRFTSEEYLRISSTAMRFWAQQNETPAVTAMLLGNARDAQAWHTLDSLRAREGIALFQDYPRASVEGLYGLPNSLARTFPQLWAISRLITSIVDGGRAKPASTSAEDGGETAAGNSQHVRGESKDPTAQLLSSTERIAKFLWTGLADAALVEARASHVRFKPLTRAFTAPDRLIFLAWFEMHWAMAELHCMYKDQGLRILRRARDHARQAQFDLLTATITSRLALHCVIVGHTAEARELLQELHKLTSELPFTLQEVEIETAVSHAGLCNDQLDPVGAAQHLARASLLGEAFESWPLLALAKTQQELYFGSPRVMLEELHRLSAKVDRHASTDERGRITLGRCVTDLFLSLGDTARAREVLASMPARHPSLTVPRARMALMTGKLSSALALASAGRWQHTITRRDQLELAFIEADAAERLGDPEAARAVYLQAIEASEASEAFTAILTLPDDRLESLDTLLSEKNRRRITRPAGARERIYPEPLPQVSLTPRELLVLRALAKGESIPQVAERLSVSANTVKKQTVSLYRKFGVHSRVEAINEARRHGFMLE